LLSYFCIKKEVKNMSYTLYKELTIVNYTAMNNKSNKYIVIHYTANKTDTAKANANYFKSTGRNASAHYFVDKTTVYQVVEDKDAAWSVGKNYGTNNLFGIVTNTNSINIEMCSNNGAIADETFNNTVELTKLLMKKYNIPVSNVYTHYQVCSKKCPGYTGWYGSNTTVWNKFKAALTSSSNTTTTSAATTTTTTKYKVGQYVTFGTSYPSPTLPCGAKYATAGSGKGKITAIVSGQAKYQIDNGARYCNDGDISGTYTPTASTSATSAIKPTTATSSTPKTKVTYISHCVGYGSWLSEITGYNTTNSNGYSGIIGKSIDKFAIKLSQGTITYVSHKKGGAWFGDISGYSTVDTNKYSGSTGVPIDAIAIKASGINGTLKYRVHTKPDNKWWSWITGYSKTDSSKYAGVFGKEIDAIQIGIE
jgi:N-acetylmuramoyl-L-alanine amidase CwlA